MPTLADSYTDLPGLRTALRESVGHPDQTVLLPDSTVDSAIQRALDRFNSDNPLLSFGTFLTVANQQSYSPLPADAFGFRKVYWPMGGGAGCPDELELNSLLDPLMGPIPGEPIDELGTRTAIEPAQLFAIIRQQSWVRHLTTRGAAIAERTVYLDPVPTQVQTVIFTYYTIRYSAALDVANNDREKFMTLVEHYLHSRLSVGAGAITHVEDTSEGTTISTAAGLHHRMAAAATMSFYRRMLKPIAPYTVFP